MNVRTFRARTGSRLDLPRPARSGLSLALCAVLPLIAGATGLIQPLSALTFAGIFAAAGAFQAALAHHELVGLRRVADGELLRGRRPYFQPALVAWRSAELTSERHRKGLARAVARTERDLSTATLPGASPLNRIAARPHVDLFRRLAERLAALDRPVNPRGVLLVEQLLRSPDSPLYARERAGELRAWLTACIDALDSESFTLGAEPTPASRHGLIPARVEREGRLAATTTRRRVASLMTAQPRPRKGN
jgi:hypothetical protein